MKKCLNFEQRKVLIGRFMCVNFKYCPMILHFCTCKSTNKIESMKKKAYIGYVCIMTSQAVIHNS